MTTSGSCAAAGAAAAPSARQATNPSFCLYSILSPRLPSPPQRHGGASHGAEPSVPGPCPRSLSVGEAASSTYSGTSAKSIEHGTGGGLFQDERGNSGDVR